MKYLEVGAGGPVQSQVLSTASSGTTEAEIEVGAGEELAAKGREQRIAVYMEWANDDERRAVEAANQRFIVEQGLI